MIATNVEVQRHEIPDLIEGPVTFDLLSDDGSETLLGVESLDVGFYNQFHLNLDSVIVTYKCSEIEASIEDPSVTLIGLIRVAVVPVHDVLGYRVGAGVGDRTKRQRVRRSFIHV